MQNLNANELYYTVYFLFGLTIISSIVVWNSNLHKDPRFNTILSLLTALTIFFTSFAIVIQLYTFHAQQNDTEVQMYDTMFTNLFHDTINYFDKNPKMNYYYDEIFKPINYTYKPPSKRYYTEEQQITRLILQDLAALVYFIENDNSMSKTNFYIIKYKINTFIKDLISSPIFVENYEQVKPNLFSLTLRNYIEKHFNI